MQVKVFNLNPIRVNTIKRNIFLITGFFLCIFLLCGCFGVKSGTKSGGGELITTFYSGEDSLMYYINSLDFKSDDREKIIMDFTYHYVDGVEGEVVTNFTLMDEEKRHDYKELLFKYDDKVIKIPEVERIYSESMKRKFRHRYTFKLTEEEFYTLLQYEPLIVFNETTFYPRKWEKKAEEINRVVLFNVEK